MNACVENDRLQIDLTDNELARLRAATRRRGIPAPTKKDMKKALLDAVASFCDKGCRHRVKGKANRPDKK